MTFQIKTSETQQLIANSVTEDFAALQKNQGYVVPKDYHVANTLQAAVAMLPQVKNIERATPDSIKKSLFDMVVQGLDPSKKQLYFIVYGDQLQMQRSYFGTQQLLKRLPEIKDINASVVREGETFEVDYAEVGRLVVTEHHTKFLALDGDIIGAYAVIEMADGTKKYEVMTKKQIEQAWNQARDKGTHNKFPAQMAERTVINRAAKNIINTTTADSALMQAVNGTTSNEYDNDKVDVTPKTETTSSSILTKLAQKTEEKSVETLVKEDEPEQVVVEEVEEGPITTSDILEAEVIEPEVPFENVPEEPVVEDVTLFNTLGELAEGGANE